jgi:hypothetical protein
VGLAQQRYRSQRIGHAEGVDQFDGVLADLAAQPVRPSR